MIKRYIRLFQSITPSALWFATYLAFVLFIPILFLTVVIQWNIIDATYNLSPDLPKLKAFAETYTKYELQIMGFASIGFLGFVSSIEPIIGLDRSQTFPLSAIKKYFLKNFARGVLITLAIASAFWVAGHYRFYGFFVASESFSVVIVKFLIRGISVLAIVYSEEFLLRVCIFENLFKNIKLPAALILTSLAHVLIKQIQFDPSLAELITIFFMSLALTLYYHQKRSFIPGMAFASAILFTFHLILSLPIHGHDTGEFKLVFLRYLPNSTYSVFVESLSGGPGGPLGSLTLQILFGLMASMALLQVLNSDKKRIG